MNFYKIRSLESGKYLYRSRGFFVGSAGTTYTSLGAAKAGYTCYRKAHLYVHRHPAEVVEFEATEVSAHKLPQ
jgi:hypothetical protein